MLQKQNGGTPHKFKNYVALFNFILRRKNQSTRRKTLEAQERATTTTHLQETQVQPLTGLNFFSGEGTHKSHVAPVLPATANSSSTVFFHTVGAVGNCEQCGQQKHCLVLLYRRL